MKKRLNFKISSKFKNQWNNLHLNEIISKLLLNFIIICDDNNLVRLTALQCPKERKRCQYFQVFPTLPNENEEIFLKVLITHFL